MKDTIKLHLIELLEEGKTYEESNEVQLIVDASDEALKFYKDYLASKEQLAGFFNKDKLEASQNKMSDFLDKQLNEPQIQQESSYRGFAGIAIAASALLIGINLYTPEELMPVMDEEKIVFIEEGIEYQIQEGQMLISENGDGYQIVEEESEPQYINTSYASSLWSAGSMMAKENNITVHQAMYAIYISNPEAFDENNINQLKAGYDLLLDESLANSVTPDFATDEVNRRVFCNC